jgi:hypothetical protein
MQSLEVGQEKGRQCRNIDCYNAWDKAGHTMDIVGINCSIFVFASYNNGNINKLV